VTTARAGLAVAFQLLSAATDASHAQPAKRARVGVHASSSEANFAPSIKVFRETLHAAGWVEGQNLTLDVPYPGEQYAQLPALADRTGQPQGKVLASLGTPATLAAKRAHDDDTDRDGVTVGRRQHGPRVEPGPARWQRHGSWWRPRFSSASGL